MAQLNLNQAIKSGGLTVAKPAAKPAPKPAPIQYGPTGPNQKPINFPVNNSLGGQVLGAATGPASSGGGQSTGGGSGQLNLNNVLSQDQPQQSNVNFDELIAPALQALESTIPTLQQGFQDYQSGQEQNRQTALQSNTANINTQTGVLNNAKTAQNQNATSAADEARRQYSEIQQGLQSRYGGTTGTGQFAGEIAGRQTLQNIGNIRTNLQQVMQQIDDKLVQVQEIGRISEQDINQQTEQRIKDANNNLQQQVAGIRQQQGTLQAQKAQMAASAIQDYQNQVNQFKGQQQQFLQQLYVQQQSAEQQLKAAQSRAGQVVQSYTAKDLTGLANQLTPAGLQLSASGKLGENGTFTNPSFSVAPAKAAEDDVLQQWLKSQGIR